MTPRNPKLTKDGRAIFRQTATMVRDGAFRNCKELIHVHLPESIREIRRRAFSGCPNLETLHLENCALEVIGEEAFAHCPKLRHVTLPDDVEVHLHVFRGCTGLEAPVFDCSRSVLYAYPSACTAKQYTVPDGVRKIESTAFADNNFLEEVLLPEGLREISFQAFCESPIRTITIPASVKELREKTFCNCRYLETVILEGDTKIEYNAFSGAPETLRLISKVRPVHAHEKYWAIGRTFLEERSVDLPDGSHLTDPTFLTLAAGCADGEPEAMWDLAGYFETRYETDQQPFYSLAANYWRFFAVLAGHDKAVDWYRRWQLMHPDTRLPAPLDESRRAENCNGRRFRYLGYLFFEEDVRYDVHPTGNTGITLICIYPHQADYWEAGNYQTTYLDEYLNYLDEYLNELPVGAVYHRPDQKPDTRACFPELWGIMGTAISASLKRNQEKRVGNPYFLNIR